MKATGIIRRIDDLGRLVFPIEIRKILGINEGDKIEIYVAENKIVCRKYTGGEGELNTGVVRPVDSLGRTVIPMELRKMLALPQRAQMQIFIDADAIILRQYESKCVFCSNDENLIPFKDKKICPSCKEQISKLQ